MGRIADAIRGTSLPEQNRKKLLTLDQEFIEMEAKIKILETENLHLQAKVNPLERQIEGLKDQIKKHATSGDQSKPQSYRMVYGCMKFAGDDNLYCPGCFHNKDKKVPTGRKNSHYRFCAACRTDIPVG